MAIWDTGFFDNDMACDWENGLKEDYSIGYFKDPLNQLINWEEDDLDIDVTCKALAVCAAVSKLFYKSGEESTYTKHLDSLISSNSIILDNEVIQLAIKAITRVINEKGELNLYWKLRGEVDSWTKSIENLDKNLREIEVE